MKDLNLFKSGSSFYLREVSSKDEALINLNCDGFLIRSGEGEARRIIASLKDKKFGGKIGIFGGDDAFNRRALESLKIDYLVSPEAKTRGDNLKQRDSGMNHVVAKIAKERGILIIVDFGAVASLDGRRKAERISRIMQNVKVCRKAGCGIRIASLGRNKCEVFDEKGKKSFGVSLGISSSEVRNCVEF